MNKAISPSRTYVAVCSQVNFNGYYFKKFTLPDKMLNNTDMASWYFLNVLDFFSCIDGCITFEDYSNIQDVHENLLKKEEEKENENES